MLAATHIGPSAAGALPLVLLPGTLCDARVFEALQKRLSMTQTRVLLTLEARSVREAAQQVLAQAPERFALLGFSLGGMVAMETVLAAPERVRGLALVSTTPLPVKPEQHEFRRTQVEDARALGMATFLRERLWPGYCGSVDCHTTLTSLEEMAQSLGSEVFSRQTEMALAREDYRPRLANVRCPTLVLAGTEDRICPPAAQQELARVLPGCKCVMLPGAGHLAVVERADEVAAAVAAWFHAAESREGVGSRHS